MMGFSGLVLAFVLVTLDPSFPNTRYEIVQPPKENATCNAIDGTIGTCFTSDIDCTGMGGEKRGNCASGFGDCCVGVILREGWFERVEKESVLYGGLISLTHDYIHTYLILLILAAMVDPCNRKTVSLNNSYDVNPGYPDHVSASFCSGSGVQRFPGSLASRPSATYTWNITKAAADVSILKHPAG